MCRHLTLLNLSEHPMMLRVGEDLARRLGELSAVQQVHYYPAGTFPPPALRGPDLLLTLDLQRLDETRLPAYRQLEADVKVGATTELWTGRRSHSSDSTSPPVIDVGWNYELQHRSRMVGYESADARYKMAAEKIAEEIGKNLAKQFGEWQEKHGLLPDLPDRFYGPYREARDVSFANDPGCRMVMSVFGLFEHNRTAWLIEDSRKTAEALESLTQRLETAGWKARSPSSRIPTESSVDLKLGARSLHIFRERDERAEADQRMGRIVVLYSEPVSDELRCAALAEWLDQKPPAEMLLRFERMAHTCSADLRERMGALIEADPPSTGRAHLSLARRYQGRGEADKAKAAVVRAALLARAAGDYSELKRELTKLAEKLGDKGLATATANPAALVDAGFAELPAASNPIEAEVVADEPVLAFARIPNDGPVMTCVRVERSVKPDHTEPYQLRITLTEGDGGSSCSTTIGLHGDEEHGWQAQHGTGLNDLRVNADAISVGSDRFRVRLSGSLREQPTATTAASSE